MFPNRGTSPKEGGLFFMVLLNTLRVLSKGES